MIYQVESRQETTGPERPIPCPHPSPTVVSRSILLAEDTIEVAALMKILLVHTGYRVIVVYDGLAAVDRLATEPVDLAILDVEMPGLDGFQVCAYIRSQDRLRQLPIIICTGRQDLADPVRLNQFKITSLLPKPFLFSELLRQVQAALLPRQRDFAPTSPISSPYPSAA